MGNTCQQSYASPSRIKVARNSDSTDEENTIGKTEGPQYEEFEPKQTEVPFGEDMYSMTILAFIVDGGYFASNKTSPLNRHRRGMRLANTLIPFIANIWIQIYLMYKVDEFIVEDAVKSIRDVYSIYEQTMYTETYLNIHGKYRGVGEKIPSNFMNLTSTQMQEVCNIPLSQPWFLVTILGVWTITILAEVRVCFRMWHLLVLSMESSDNWTECLVVEGETLKLKKIPRSMKLKLVFVFLPWIVITSYLWWLGARWLVGTNSFSDILMNAVALEFVLVLKELVFRAFLSKRCQLDVANTAIAVPEDRTGIALDVCEANMTIILVLITAVIVFAYMGLPAPFKKNGFQGVLTDYKWDVLDICEGWIKWKFCTKNCKESFEM